ncbi:adenosylcobinamide-GDP ribazoletransferase [uncultured Treponema sp.]|uniref:adenosylcobinamide-GDP ribazoletransferase n=1 Tax=uncultured Treponema sp. TaxID=162155 RepID=UPI0025CB97F7|nr:adenosylcobinamide-GDP ribazoletransferase [uncultured Treponema sp.]
MSFLKSIAITFGTFSAIPVPRVEWNQKNMRYMMAAFPLVGLVIALVSLACFVFGIRLNLALSRPLSLHLIALIFTLLPVFITGGIHLDGFMDTCDALASRANREKKLEILKDSHSGAFAVLGCVLYFLSYYLLTLEVCDYFFGSQSSSRFANFFVRFMTFLPLVSVFVMSRLLSAFAVATFPIAKNSGLVHTFASASARKFTAIFCYLFFFLISSALIYFWHFLGIALVGASLSIFCFYFIVAVKNFGGITGDTAGWFLQMCEIFDLAIFVVFTFVS